MYVPADMVHAHGGYDSHHPKGAAVGWQLHERPQCQQQLGPSREQVSNFETMAVYYC